MGLRGLSWALAALAVSLAFPPRLSAQRRVQRATPPPRTSGGLGSRTGQSPIPREKTPIEEFETMSPAEQQKAMDRLPPGERKQLQDRLDRFHQLPAEQQHALISFYHRLH